MLTESHDEEQIIPRVAALDIGKAELVCCVRVPAGAETKKRLQEVSTRSTMTRAVTELANHLVELGVQRVVMEATSDYVEAAPKPMCSMRSDCARSPNGRCCGPVSCRHARSAGYGT